MEPERTIKISNHKIEEFYWNGKMVVYLDGHKVQSDYEKTVQYVKTYFKEAR